MPRTAKNPSLSNRTQRAKLPISKNGAPYWHLIAEGQHLGYRKSERGSTWVARYYTTEHGRRYQALGNADDSVTANETHVLSFGDAIKAAETWTAAVMRADNAGVKMGRYTVADAAGDWLATWRGTERGKQTAAANVKLHILPTLGTTELGKLSRAQVERWLHDLAGKAARQGAAPASHPHKAPALAPQQAHLRSG